MAAPPPANGHAAANGPPEGFVASNPRRDMLGDLPDNTIQRMTKAHLKLWIERAGGIRGVKSSTKKADLVATLKSLRNLASAGQRGAGANAGAVPAGANAGAAQMHYYGQGSQSVGTVCGNHSASNNSHFTNNNQMEMVDDLPDQSDVQGRR